MHGTHDAYDIRDIDVNYGISGTHGIYDICVANDTNRTHDAHVCYDTRAAQQRPDTRFPYNLGGAT